MDDKKPGLKLKKVNLEKIIGSIKQIEHNFNDIALIRDIEAEALVIAGDRNFYTDKLFGQKSDLKGIIQDYLYSSGYMDAAKYFNEEFEIIYRGGKNKVIYNTIKNTEQADLVGKVCNSVRKNMNAHELYLMGSILSESKEDYDDVDLGVIGRVNEKDLIYNLAAEDVAITRTRGTGYTQSIIPGQFLVLQKGLKPVHIYLLKKKELCEPNRLIDNIYSRRQRFLIKLNYINEIAAELIWKLRPFKGWRDTP